MAITIAALLGKGKYHLLYGGHFEEACEVLILVAVALGAFACGRLSVLEERAVPVVVKSETIKEKQVSTGASSSLKTIIGESEQGRVSPPPKGSVVASKNSDRYHLPWCGGARTIKEENKIWFSTEADAIAAGYTKAGNCK